MRRGAFCAHGFRPRCWSRAALPEAAGADEIAERDVWRATVGVERVGIAHVAEEDAGDEPDKQQAPADIFVRADHLKEDGEDGGQQRVDRRRYDEPADILR